MDRNNLSLSSRTKKQSSPKIPHCTHKSLGSHSLQGAQFGFIYPSWKPIWSPALRLCPAGEERTPGRQGWTVGPSPTRQEEQRYHHQEPRLGLAD